MSDAPAVGPDDGTATSTDGPTAAELPVEAPPAASGAPASAGTESSSAPPPAAAMRIVVVSAVVMELPGVHPQVVLREAEGPGRELRIPVGFAEGTAIAYALKGVQRARPLTHTLLVDLLYRHGVEVDALRITGKVGAVYLAELDTSGPRGRAVVECRPSDGFALILRRALPTPILVAEELFMRPAAG
ncbi:MAG TPA: bifunctional nuclease family protein [Acidimicrobiales bacterium]|nr:bifunctional nuclease family protein [Acidimicrobiales bacterium]